MAPVIAEDTAEITNVGMGQIVLARKPARLSAVVGSCVGVGLYHARLQLAVFAHVVLPDSCGRAATPGKFADTAVPYMLQLLQRHGGTTNGLLAKLAGGACMFGSGGPMQIGDSNVQGILRALGAAGIRVAGKDVGGHQGRRISFDCGSGAFTVESIGHPPRNL